MPARILVIEDNPTNLELMIYLLTAYGYQSLTAMDGLEGIEAAQRERPDLIICDVQLPKADGFEVVRTLKALQEFKKVPLIAVTALAMVGDRERLLSAGFDGYLAKPIQPEKFVKQVEAFLPPELQASARQDAAWKETPAEARPDLPLNGTVLVLDDTGANRDLLRSILEPHGYRVLAAATILQAEEVIRRDRPDLLISDVHLRDGTSIDFIRRLQNDLEFQSMSVMFQSASAEELERIEIGELKGIKLLPRPMAADQILAEVRKILLPAGTKERTACR